MLSIFCTCLSFSAFATSSWRDARSNRILAVTMLDLDSAADLFLFFALAHLGRKRLKPGRRSRGVSPYIVLSINALSMPFRWRAQPVGFCYSLIHLGGWLFPRRQQGNNVCIRSEE